MAKLVYVTNTSLDGYIEDQYGAFDLYEPDDDAHRNGIARSRLLLADGGERGTGLEQVGGKKIATIALKILNHSHG